MSHVEMWTGLPGSGRHEAARALAMEMTAAGRTVWWLVDSQRYGAQLERSLAEAAGGALVGLDVLVAGRLPGQLLAAAGLEPATVDVEVRELVLARLLAGQDQQGPDGLELGEGWARHLSQLYERLHEQEDPIGGELARQLGKRMAWARKLLQQYSELLGRKGAVDEAQLPRIALAELGKGDLDFPELLIVDRLGPQPGPLLRLLHALAGRCERSIVLQDDEPELEQSAPLALARIDRQGWQREHHPEQRHFPTAAFPRELARELFALRPRPVTKQGAPKLRVEHAVDRASELRTVARQIARLQQQARQPLSIGVVVTSLDDYADSIQEIFPRYGIRPELQLGAPLSTSPVARLAATLMQLAVEGLSRERVTELLLNPYARWGEHLSSKAAVLALDSAARQARIADGRGDFELAWAAPLQAQAQRLQALAQRELDEDDDKRQAGEVTEQEQARRRASLLRQAQAIELALAELRKLQEAVSALPDPCGADEAASWLWGMIEQLGVRDRVHEHARRDPERGQRDVRALGQLTVSLRHVASALDLLGGARTPLAVLAELLVRSVATARLRPARRLGGGVPVMGPLELRGMRFDKLFFLGLTASKWPRDPERDIANPHGGSWLRVDRLAESRALTWEALCASPELQLSTPCPPRGSEAPETPSSLLEEIEAAGLVLERSAPGQGPRQEGSSWHSLLDLLPDVGRLGGSIDEDGQAQRSRALAALAALGEVPDEATAQLAERAHEALAIEIDRLDPRSLTRYEGDLRGSSIGAELADRVLERPLSATRLDRYAGCPMRFFLGSVLGVEELEDVDEEVEGRLAGSMVHEIIARATRQLREEQEGPPAFDANLERSRAVFAEQAREVLERQPFDNLHWQLTRHAIISGLEDDDEEPGYLMALLQHHASKKMAGERVHFAEASFGLPPDEEAELLDEEPLELADEGADPVRLAGRIDRISRHPAKGWRVWDYKVTSSSQKTRAHIIKGLSFQLPLYLWALERHLSSSTELDETIDFACLYQIKGEGRVSETGSWKLSDHQEHGPELVEQVLSIRDAIAGAHFHHPLSQDDKLCPEGDYNYCPFQDVCRRDHDLWRRRPEKLRAEALQGLHKLPEQRFEQGGEAGR